MFAFRSHKNNDLLVNSRKRLQKLFAQPNPINCNVKCSVLVKVWTRIVEISHFRKQNLFNILKDGCDTEENAIYEGKL